MTNDTWHTHEVIIDEYSIGLGIVSIRYFFDGDGDGFVLMQYIGKDSNLVWLERLQEC